MKSGETARVSLGGSGALVKGRLKTSPERDDIPFELSPQNLRPAGMKIGPGQLPQGYGFFCRPDGSFIIEDVLPGAYVLEVQLRSVKDRNNPDPFQSNFGFFKRDFEVMVAEGESEISLGDFVVPVK